MSTGSMSSLFVNPKGTLPNSSPQISIKVNPQDSPSLLTSASASLHLSPRELERIRRSTRVNRVNTNYGSISRGHYKRGSGLRLHVGDSVIVNMTGYFEHVQNQEQLNMEGGDKGAYLKPDKKLVSIGDYLDADADKKMYVSVAVDKNYIKPGTIFEFKFEYEGKTRKILLRAEDCGSAINGWDMDVRVRFEKSSKLPGINGRKILKVVGCDDTGLNCSRNDVVCRDEMK